MKKVVLKLDIHDDKAKQKAMKAVSSIPGIVSIAMDMKEKKMSVIGDVDPVAVVSKLRKSWHTEVLTIGEPEKKKEEPKKAQDKAKDPQVVKTPKDPNEEIADLVWRYNALHPYRPQVVYYVQTEPDYPNASTCVILLG